MKKLIYKSILAMLVCASFSSCEEDLIVYDTPNGFVQLNTEASASLNEAATEPLVTQVLLGTGSNPNGVTVNYTVTSSDPSRYTVTPSGGSLTIPAGEFSAEIAIEAINNDVADGPVDIVLELAPSDLPLGLGGEGSFTSRTINLVDDDCALDISEFVGSYDVTMTLERGFIYAAGTYSLTSNLTLGANPNTVVDPDFGFLSLSGRAAVPVTIELDESSLTASMTGSTFTFLDGSTVDDAVYAYGSTPNRRFFTGGEPGELSTCGLSFTVRAFIRREDGSIGQIMTLTYTRN